MKKQILTTLALATALLLSGCASSSMDSASSSSSSTSSALPESVIVSTTTETTSSSSSGYSSGDITQYVDGLKLVYNGDMTLETTDFDSVAQSLADLVSQYNGYFSSTNVGQYGSNYRYGEYTVRIPAEYYDAFHQSVGDLTLVTRDKTSVEDISATYYDTQGRLETQQIKLERLQALLEQAENMEDLITIEAAISETQWEIDNLSGDMNYYDSIVDYATIDISLNEVYQLSNIQEAPKSFWERIGNGFEEGGLGFLNFVEELVVTLAYSWTFIVFVAVMAVGVLKVRPSVIRKIHAKKKKKESE